MSATTPRAAVLALVLLAGAAFIRRATGPVATPHVDALQRMPMRIADWDGRDTARFGAAVLKVLGADAYINRVYAAEAGPPVALYVGYYASQRQGDAIHSPMNCMPGAGWEPVEHSVVDVAVPGPGGSTRSIAVNEYVVQKGGDRQLLLYWYQSHGRVVANEYASRIYMVYDAVRRKGNDAALVRVLTPVAEEGADARAAAAARARAFVAAMFPHLLASLPS